MRVRRGVLNARRGHVGVPGLHLTGSKSAIISAILAPRPIEPLMASGELGAEGDFAVYAQYRDLLDTFDPNYAVGMPLVE